MDYGRRFRTFRANVNLTQKQAAELIGVKDYQLANYETNRSQPNINVLKKMSKVYQVSIDRLVGNNVLANKYVAESKEEECLDVDELLTDLNEVVEKIIALIKSN